MTLDPHDQHSTLTESSERELPAGEPALVFIGSPEKNFADAGQILPLDNVNLVRFGRMSGTAIDWKVDGEVAHLGIPVPWVSSAHAELSLRRSEEGVYSLRDLGSRNGTHCEGRRIARATRLRPGEIIELGRSFWMLREISNAKRTGPRVEFEGLIGTANPELNAAYQQLARVSRSSVSILLQGETGTGKRMTAEAIHKHSGREGEFIAVNLAAVSDADLDDVLSGPEGIFARAQNGTVFLDELAELSPTAQSKLLAALDRHEIGGGEEEDVVRIVSSTLVPLASEPRRGFRPDLHARLAGFHVQLPPLRGRREDLGRMCQALPDRPVKIGTPAFRRILAYRWPFNLRELRQTLATAKLLAGDGGELTSELIADLLARRADAPSDADSIRSLREQIVRTLASNRGSTDAAANALELSSADLHRWIERFDIRPEDYATEHAAPS